MPNRKVIAFALPALIGATIVGSGFAAWYFGEDVHEDHNVSVTVTDKVNAGTFTVTYNRGSTALADNSMALVLDQGYKGLTDANKGIHFTVGDPAELLSSINWKYECDNTAISAAGKTITILSTVSINKVLIDTYLSLDTTWPMQNVTADSYVYTVATTAVSGDETTGEISTASEADTATTFKNNAIFSWRDKPTNESDYQDMQTDLSGNLITFSFDVVVGDAA
ncbi:MAG: hypothetical protein ACI32C_03805 [Candidatus Enteromonas sp.]